MCSEIPEGAAGEAGRLSSSTDASGRTAESLGSEASSVPEQVQEARLTAAASQAGPSGASSETRSLTRVLARAVGSEQLVLWLMR
jgi:hypothetical protein